MNINIQYQSIISSILKDGHRERNNRTGAECCSLPGVTFQTDLEVDGFPLLSLRTIPYKSFIAEQMWFLSGSKDTKKFLSSHTKIWDSFTDADGSVSSAYGFRWKHQHGIDQLQTVVDKLKKDPTSRHGVVITWDPFMDLITPQKNVPCPYTFTLMIIGGRLHLHNIVRSNDMLLGFPMDVAGFALLQMILAEELNVRLGIYTHSISNAHIYSDHYSAAEELLQREASSVPLQIILPKNSFSRAHALDEHLFTELSEEFKLKYSSGPKIDLKITL